MGIGHCQVILRKPIDIGAINAKKTANGAEQLVDALVDRTKSELDKFSGQPGNQFLKTRLKLELRFAVPQGLLQFFVVLNVVELTVPDGTAIGLALRHRMGLKPLIMAIQQLQTRPVTPRLQSLRRVHNTVGHPGRVLRVNYREYCSGVFVEQGGFNAKQVLYLIADVGVTVGLTIRAEPIGKQDSRNS